MSLRKGGVSDGDRTHDHRNHNPALYQLSYAHHNGNVNSSVFLYRLNMLLNRDIRTNLNRQMRGLLNTSMYLTLRAIAYGDIQNCFRQFCRTLRFEFLPTCHLIYSLAGYKLNGAPERIRTSDPRLRRPLLYPAELRAQCVLTIFNIDLKF